MKTCDCGPSKRFACSRWNATRLAKGDGSEFDHNERSTIDLEASFTWATRAERYSEMAHMAVHRTAGEWALLLSNLV